MSEFFKNLKDFLFGNRINTLILVMSIAMVLLVGRLFSLQIVNGKDFQDNYRLKVERQEIINATRGNIYDKNGNPLAYNKLVNAVVIEDIGTYKNEQERNSSINGVLAEIIQNLDRIGDDVYIDFGITLNEDGKYEFNVEGSRLLRFRADIFGHANPEDLKYNDRLGINETVATPDEIMDYLCDRRYSISEEYDKATRYRIATIRYRMGLNSYQKYISTTVASDVSKEAVAYIMENKYLFTGIDIEEQSIRVYEEAECFSNVLGYTGTISYDEYERLKQDDDSYTLNDVVGKAGIEQYMNSELMGKKGYQTVYVDSLGNLLETAQKVDQQSGRDVYLSIDKDLTVKTYNLLERQIAGILHSKMLNIKDKGDHLGSDDIIIPIYDVYNALVSNRVLSITKTDGLSDAESIVYGQFEKKFDEVIDTFGSQLNSDHPVAYNELDDQFQTYSTYLVRRLKSDSIFDQSLIDQNDEIQKSWSMERLSVNEYLRHAIEMNWINVSGLIRENEYVDTTEVYADLISYSLELLRADNDFKRTVFYYALMEDRINLGALLSMLYDQKVLSEDPQKRAGLMDGSIDPYDFVKDKVFNLEITPGQLGLDPCSGSCVVMDPNSGSLLALVTYPGYDSNKLANNLDSGYYAYLSTNKSSPLYNHATQERTAPGSTYKLVSSTAGLAEGVIDPETEIKDEGMFDKVSNEPKCWIYPGNHGVINLEEAIRDSCNYYFYEVGYRLAGSTTYNDRRGISRISEYASMYGLDDKTGIEIEEVQSELATEFPVMAAIGQSDNNFTTISLARYVSAVANKGTVYNLSLLSKVTEKDGTIVSEFGPTVKNKIDVLSYSDWNAIHNGMRMMVEESAIFKGFPETAAGKTGTAQQVLNRPNHALFVGFAPFDRPEVAIACRISFGYTSANAADLARRVMSEYFGVGDYSEQGSASNINTNNRITD